MKLGYDVTYGPCWCFRLVEKDHSRTGGGGSHSEELHSSCITVYRLGEQQDEREGKRRCGAGRGRRRFTVIQCEQTIGGRPLWPHFNSSISDLLSLCIRMAFDSQSVGQLSLQARKRARAWREEGVSPPPRDREMEASVSVRERSGAVSGDTASSNNPAGKVYHKFTFHWAS